MEVLSPKKVSEARITPPTYLSESLECLYNKLYYDFSDLLPYLIRSDVHEIMLNPDGGLWIDSNVEGLNKVTHLSNHKAFSIINAVAGIHNFVVSAEKPRLEAQLPLFKEFNGERFTAQVPPIVSGPSFSLRKRTESVYTLEDYVATKRMTLEQADILKKLVHELLVSQDGGVPLMMKSWDGNASDNIIFKERAEMLIEEFSKSETARYLIADSKLYFEGNARALKGIKYITRIPGNIKEGNKLIVEAIKEDKWKELDVKNKYHVKEITHYGILQRWIIVYSERAREGSKNTLERAIKKEKEELEKKIWHLSNKGFDCEKDAEKALYELVKKYRYHTILEKEINEKKTYAESGRQKKGIEAINKQYFVIGRIQEDKDIINERLEQKSCYVIGKNIMEEELNAVEIIRTYKKQNISIENTGFKFLKDPIFLRVHYF